MIKTLVFFSGLICNFFYYEQFLFSILEINPQFGLKLKILNVGINLLKIGFSQKQGEKRDQDSSHRLPHPN